MTHIKSKEAKILTRRSRDIFRHQRDRARQAGAVLGLTLDQLRRKVMLRLGMPCSYCCQPLTAQNFSLDHRQPLSRGGTWDADNLVVICLRCNKIKGNLCDDEFRHFIDAVLQLDEVARKDIMARLYAGGRRFFR
jgi:5-methylcytosine-specific restriction endonuclease McrA